MLSIRAEYRKSNYVLWILLDLISVQYLMFNDMTVLIGFGKYQTIVAYRNILKRKRNGGYFKAAVDHVEDLTGVLMIITDF